MSNRKRKILPNIFRDRVIVAFLIVLQILVLIALPLFGANYSIYISVSLYLISFIISLVVVMRRTKGAYKLTWIYLILCFPVFGGLLYLVFSIQGSMRLMKPYMNLIDEKTDLLDENALATSARAIIDNPSRRTQITYLCQHAGFPAYDNTSTRYLATGEEYYEALLDSLKKANKYIFLEYFIIAEGRMHDTIMEILKERAAAGVTVRLLYDDFGCIFLLPKRYPEMLAEYGIECRAFNRFRPILTGLQNNRDHRKICSIDGRIAFTGGINLADEYINEIEKYGRWKDSGVILEGAAAWSLTVIFMKMWMLTSPDGEPYESIESFRPESNLSISSCYPSDGYVQPYCDSPLDTDHVCEHIYSQLISNAKKYLYICTPYLIVDDSMISDLVLAAQSGVDVRIITPHVWDKKMVHITTRSYYMELIEGGVRIFEYTPGFIHSKVFVSDDEVASVGTANLDFRSLYLHFECGTMLYGSKAVTQAKEDFLNTLSECHEITSKDCKLGLFMRLITSLLRLISPLL